MAQQTLPFLAALCLSVGLATAPCVEAQDNSATVAPAVTAPTSSQKDGSSPAKAAVKKVWTNENVTDLHDNSTISTFNQTRALSPKPEHESQTVSLGTVAQYHDQIAKLEAQLPPLDRRIEALQEGIDGKPTGNGKDSTRRFGVRGGDWRTEESQLQANRDRIAAQISALRDEARHKGVLPSALP